MDRGAWWATVHGGRKESDTTERLSNDNQQFSPQKTHCVSPDIKMGKRESRNTALIRMFVKRGTKVS